MKKVVLLFSAAVLIAGLTFAQTPQTQEKPVKAEKEMSKDDKAGCDTKTKAACGDAKKSGCCSSAKKASTPAATPEKK